MQSSLDAYEETNALFDAPTQYDPGSIDVSTMDDSANPSKQKSHFSKLRDLVGSMKSPHTSPTRRQGSEQPQVDAHGEGKIAKDSSYHAQERKPHYHSRYASSDDQDLENYDSYRQERSLKLTYDEEGNLFDGSESSDCESDSENTTPHKEAPSISRENEEESDPRKRKRYQFTPVVPKVPIATPMKTASEERAKRRRIRNSPHTDISTPPSSGKRPSRSKEFQLEIERAIQQVKSLHYHSPSTVEKSSNFEKPAISSSSENFEKEVKAKKEKVEMKEERQKETKETNQQKKDFEEEYVVVSANKRESKRTAAHKKKTVDPGFKKKPSKSRLFEMEVQKAIENDSNTIELRLRKVERVLNIVSNPSPRKSSRGSSRSSTNQEQQRRSSTRRSSQQNNTAVQSGNEARDSEVDSEIESFDYGASSHGSPEKAVRVTSKIFSGIYFAISLSVKGEKDASADELDRMIRENSGQIWETETLKARVQTQYHQAIFVQKSLSSTLKSLIGQAMIYPIVHPDYIRRCVKESRLILPIPREYLLNAHMFEEPVEEFYPSDHNYRLFSGSTFAIASNSSEFINVWKSIAMAAGAGVGLLSAITNEKMLAGQIRKATHILLDEADPPNNHQLIIECCNNLEIPIVKCLFFVESIKRNQPFFSEHTEITSYGTKTLDSQSDYQAESSSKLQNGTHYSKTHNVIKNQNDMPPKQENSEKQSKEQMLKMENDNQAFQHSVRANEKKPVEVGNTSTERKQTVSPIHLDYSMNLNNLMEPSTMETNESENLDDAVEDEEESHEIMLEKNQEEEHSPHIQKQIHNLPQSHTNQSMRHRTINDDLADDSDEDLDDDACIEIVHDEDEMTIEDEISELAEAAAIHPLLQSTIISHLKATIPDVLENWKSEYAGDRTLKTQVVKANPSYKNGLKALDPLNGDNGFATQVLAFLQKEAPKMYRMWLSEYNQGKSFSKLNFDVNRSSTHESPIPSYQQITSSLSTTIQELKPIGRHERLIEFFEEAIREDDIGLYYNSVRIDGKVYRVNDTVFFNPGNMIDIGVIKSIRSSQLGDELSVFEYQRFLTFEGAKKQGLITEGASQEEYHPYELFLTESRLSLRLERVVCQAKVLCPRLAPSEECRFHFCRRRIVNKAIVKLSEFETWNGFLSSVVLLEKEPERVEDRDHYANIAIHGVQISFGLWVYVRGVDQLLRKFICHYAIVDDIFKLDGFVYIQFRKCRKERGVVRAIEGDEAMFVLVAHQIIDIYPLSIINHEDSPDHVPRLTKEDFSSKPTVPMTEIYNRAYTSDVVEAGLNVLKHRVKVVPF